MSPLLASSSVLSPSVSPFPSGPLRTSQSPLPSTEELKVMLWGGSPRHSATSSSPSPESPARDTCPPQGCCDREHLSATANAAPPPPGASGSARHRAETGVVQRAPEGCQGHTAKVPLCAYPPPPAASVPRAPRIQGVQEPLPKPPPLAPEVGSAAGHDSACLGQFRPRRPCRACPSSWHTPPTCHQW